MMIRAQGSAPSAEPNASTVRAAVSDAAARHLPGVRADGNSASQAIDVQRAMIRAAAERQVAEANATAQLRGEKRRVPAGRADELAEAWASGLGLRWDAPARRFDSGFAGSRISGQTSIPVVMPTVDNGVQTAIPVRGGLDADAELVQTNTVRHTGTAGVYQGGSLTARANSAEGSKQAQVATVYTVTEIDFQALMFGSSSGLNKAETNAQSARLALETAIDELLVSSPAGLAFRSLNNLGLSDQLVDVDVRTAPLGALGAAIRKAINRLIEANGYRGAPTAAVIASRLAMILNEKNTLDAGGAVSSGMVGKTISEAAGNIELVIQSLGLGDVVAAPRLINFAGTANEDVIVLHDPRNPNSLRHMLCMAPSPVRTASTLGADQELWILRSAGLEAPDATGCGILRFKVPAE